MYVHLSIKRDDVSYFADVDGEHTLGERLAHPPLGARANVEREVEVVVIIKAAEQGGS